MDSGLKNVCNHAKEGQPIVYIRIKRLKPIRSRIEDLEIVV